LDVVWASFTARPPLKRKRHFTIICRGNFIPGLNAVSVRRKGVDQIGVATGLSPFRRHEAFSSCRQAVSYDYAMNLYDLSKHDRIHAPRDIYHAKSILSFSGMPRKTPLRVKRLPAIA